jgi:hypothetical protein
MMFDDRPREERVMTPPADDSRPASERIDKIIADIGDWRGETLGRMRELIRKADRDVVEEIKWAKPSNPDGVPTWTHDGIICTGEVYKEYVKLTFANGASLDDPSGLFNAGLGGGTRRAIDIREGDKVNATAFKALIKSAVAFNEAKAASKKK